MLAGYSLEEGVAVAVDLNLIRRARTKTWNSLQLDLHGGPVSTAGNGTLFVTARSGGRINTKSVKLAGAACPFGSNGLYRQVFAIASAATRNSSGPSVTFAEMMDPLLSTSMRS